MLPLSGARSVVVVGQRWHSLGSARKTGKAPHMIKDAVANSCHAWAVSIGGPHAWTGWSPSRHVNADIIVAALAC